MYCMMCLSRAVSWSSGWTSTLPGIATFERELSGSSGSQIKNNLAARVALLQLEEQVYTGLYSDEATRQGPGATGQKALSRSRKLQDWAVEHSDDLCESQESHAQSNHPRDDLAIRLYSIQALAAWPIAEDAEACCSLLDISRSALRLFQRLWKGTPEKSHYLNLAL